MATTVAVTYEAKCTVQETLDTTLAPAASASNRKITHDQYNWSGTLNSGTTPPATDVLSFVKALSAGAATIDLTAITHEGRTIDGTGKKVQIFKARNKPTNANPITIQPGASNGYDLAGASSKIVLNPGDHVMLYCHDTAPDIASGDKTIDLSGTGAQELELEIVLG